MNDLRWINQTHPPTLQSAVLLSYFQAVSLLLFSNTEYRVLPFDLFDRIGLGRLAFDLSWVILMFAFVAGGLGIASEKKWGYRVDVVAAWFAVISVLWAMQRFSEFGDLGLLLGLMFDIVLVVLLLHPMSKEYRRIWFR